MDDTILYTVTKLLGLSNVDDGSFNVDILTQINFAINRLFQIGLNSARGFVCDENSKWEDLIEDSSNLQMIKSYIVAKVRKAFDPPQSSVHMQALNDVINETEWCICVATDPGEFFD